MNKLLERFSELELSLTPNLMKPAKIHLSEVTKHSLEQDIAVKNKIRFR